MPSRTSASAAFDAKGRSRITYLVHAVAVCCLACTRWSSHHLAKCHLMLASITNSSHFRFSLRLQPSLYAIVRDIVDRARRRGKVLNKRRDSRIPLTAYAIACARSGVREIRCRICARREEIYRIGRFRRVIRPECTCRISNAVVR